MKLESMTQQRLCLNSMLRSIHDNVDGASCSIFCVFILELEAPATFDFLIGCLTI